MVELFRHYERESNLMKRDQYFLHFFGIKLESSPNGRLLLESARCFHCLFVSISPIIPLTFPQWVRRWPVSLYLYIPRPHLYILRPHLYIQPPHLYILPPHPYRLPPHLYIPPCIQVQGYPPLRHLHSQDWDLGISLRVCVVCRPWR